MTSIAQNRENDQREISATLKKYCADYGAAGSASGPQGREAEGNLRILRECGMNVIAMIKKTSNVSCELNGKRMNIKQIFAASKKPAPRFGVPQPVLRRAECPCLPGLCPLYAAFPAARTTGPSASRSCGWRTSWLTPPLPRRCG